MSAHGNILTLSPTDLPVQPVSDPPSEAYLPTETCAADTLSSLVRLIRDSGMDPVTQLAGYLTTDDPTYLPDIGHARLLADRIGRDKLLETLIELYLKKLDPTESQA